MNRRRGTARYSIISTETPHYVSRPPPNIEKPLATWLRYVHLCITTSSRCFVSRYANIWARTLQIKSKFVKAQYLPSRRAGDHAYRHTDTIKHTNSWRQSIPGLEINEGNKEGQDKLARLLDIDRKTQDERRLVQYTRHTARDNPEHMEGSTNYETHDIDKQ